MPEQPNPCRVCTADDMERIEEIGRRCLSGELSWRMGAKEAGLKYFQPLKNHMEKHFVSEDQQRSREIDEDLQREIDQAASELIAEMQSAPPTVKPLYVTAIKNLREIADTKPSQQHLIQALKAVHEITGMGIEQRLMLEFAAHAFPGEVLAPAAHDPVRELGVVQDVIEAEIVDE